MTAFQSTRDAVSYTWNNNNTLRFCCKLITCPLFGDCYYMRKRTRSPSEKQLKRYTVLADVKHRRRVRRVARKRIPSVDGERWWNSKAKGQSQSPLFAKLPLELRLQIYEMVLCDQEELTMRFNEDQPWDRWKVRAEQGRDAKMLRTCKKIYREAASVLYSKNTFKFDSYKLLSTFVSTIPPHRLASIRKVVLVITLFWNGCDGFIIWYRDLLPLLRGMQGLEEVCLRYRLRENNYVVHPCFSDFTLLEWLEEGKIPREYAIFYEMLEVQTGPRFGGMLFDRWAIGERRRIDMKK